MRAEQPNGISGVLRRPRGIMRRPTWMKTSIPESGRRLSHLQPLGTWRL